MSSRLQERTDSFKQQLLTAQRRHLIGHLETTISGYEEQIDRQQKLLDVILQPKIKLRGAAETADVQQLSVIKDSFKQQLLTAPREDLIGHFETTISRYEKEIDRQQKLLDAILQPEIKLRRAVVPPDVQKLLVIKEEVPPEQQGWEPSLDQEDPEAPHIKEEQEEAWVTKFPFTPVPVKNEDEDEEKPQSSQLHQRQTEQMETETDGEDCGGPDPPRNSHPDPVDKTEDSAETESDGCDKDWKDRKSFRCLVCGKTFKQKGNLTTHMRTHTGVKPFSCSFCNKRFTQKTGLDYHLRIHTGEKPFSCSICGKTYRHKGALTYHMAIHTGEKPYSCSICGKRFRGASQLRLHKCVNETSERERREKPKKPLSCSECDATFPNNYLLVTHIRMHKGKKLFTCTVCGKKLQFSSHLEIHMRTHTGEKPYSCSVCGKGFSQRGIMRQHMAVHSGVKPFSCSDCGRRFFWQFQIKRHKCIAEFVRRRRIGFGGSEPVRNLNTDKHLKSNADKETFDDDSDDIDFWNETRQHQSGFTYRRNKTVSRNDGYNTGKEPFSCSDDMTKTETRIDDKQTRQHQSDLKHVKHEDKKPFSSNERHRRSGDSHNLGQTGEKPFRCFFCGKRFVTGGHLTRHLTVHVGEKLLSCVICEKTFTLESELMSHECVQELSQLHSDNKYFSCSHCGKGFDNRHHLQAHMRIHAGEKPCRCSVCGKTFARREILSLHMTCHTAESFHCTVCNTGFVDSESLIKHMRIHTRQTQFSCSICGKEFAWRRYLTKHMEVHGKEELYRCSVCDRGFTQLYQLNYHQCAGHPSSQLHQSQTEESREPLVSTSAEQIKTEADGEDCGEPEPARSSAPDRDLQFSSDDKTSESSEPETEVSDGDWEETRESNLNSVKHNEVSPSEETCNTVRKRFSCLECGETFHHDHLLSLHIEKHTAEKQLAEREGLSRCIADMHRGTKLEAPHIKEEQQEVWISQEGEQPQVPFTPVPVKSEDDEYKLQSSQLHQRQNEQMKTENDGEDYGGPEPAANSHSGTHLTPDTDVTKISEPQSDLYCLKISGLKKPVNCPVCGKQFSNNSSVKTHMRIHTGEKPYNCNICNKKFMWRSMVKRHRCIVRSTRQTRHSQIKANGEDCGEPKPARSLAPDIDLQFSSDDKTSESSEPETEVSDGDWEETRESILNSVKHNEVSPSDETCNTDRKRFSCSECGETFHNDHLLNLHVKKHTGEKQLTERGSLSRCIADMHRETKLEAPHIKEEQQEVWISQEGEQPQVPFTPVPVKSENDEYKLQSSQLHQRQNEQMKTENDGEDYGGPEPATNSHSGTHLTPDTDVTKISEPQSDLHCLKISGCEKPVNCPVCGKQFSNNSSVKTHMRIHTGEKPYNCNICNKKFMWGSMVKRHRCIVRSTRQTRHRAIKANGEDCGEPKPARSSAPDIDLQFSSDDKASGSSESETEVSDGDWEETREHQSGLNSLSSNEVPVSDAECDTGKEPFTSFECGERFTEKSSLMTHMRIHTGEKPFSCSQCGKRFYRKGHLIIHTRIHTGERPLSCPECGKGFVQEAALNSHLKCHTGEKPYSCSLCNKSFIAQKYLQLHMRTHTEEKPYCCNVCDERFTWSYQVKSHSCSGKSTQLHGPWTSQEGEELQGQEAADITGFTSTPVPVKTENDEEKPQSSQLHQRQSEQIKTETEGEDCEGPEPARTSHPDTHLQPDTDDSVDSDFWKETRKRPSGLNSLKNDEISKSGHRYDSGKHASEPLEAESGDSVDSDFWKDSSRPYSCSECGQRFPQIHHLKNHMRFHSEKEPKEKEIFVCSVCGQTCLYKSHLKIHMRTHTGEKPFSCPVCGKKYAHKASMQSHMVVHNVNKQYACNVCDKSFAWFTELKYHQCVGESSHETPFERETN